MTKAQAPPLWHRSAKAGRKAPRHSLTTLPGCISEIARVYRAFKRGDITADVARTRTYILDKLRAGLEAQTLASKYAKLRRRVEALHQAQNERFDIFGDGSVLLTGAEIRLLMESLDGSSRGLPSERISRND